MTVIATDGYPVEPLTVDRFVSQAGERFDMVVEATNNMGISEFDINNLYSMNLTILKNKTRFRRREIINSSSFGCLCSKRVTGIRLYKIRR